MGRKTKEEQMAQKEFSVWDKNYAKNAGLAEKTLNMVLEMVETCKANRSGKELEWLEDYKSWSCQPNDLEIYAGRSNLFVPEMHHQIESSVQKYQQAMFPTDQYIKCVGMRDTDLATAQNIEDAVYYELDYKNSFPTLMERFNRQKVMYGTSFLKCSFVDNLKEIYVMNKNGHPEKQRMYNPQVKWGVSDLFHTYVYPENVNDLNAALVVWEEAFVPVKSIKDNKSYVNNENIEGVSSDIVWNWIDVVRLNVQNLSTAADARKDSALLTEVWMDLDLGDGEVPVCIKVVNLNTIVSIKRNPLWFQTPPYLVGRYLQAPTSEFYGRALPEKIRLLQAQMNDLTNQSMDSMNYALNPIALIDPGYAGDTNSFKITPGAKWYASPQGVQFTSFPNVAPAGFEAMGQVRQMIQQFSDNAIQMAPQLSGKVRSAAQANLVSQESSADSRNMIRSDETDVLIPACKMTHILLQQFMKSEYMIKVQGPSDGEWITKKVKPGDIVGDVDFTWKGSNFAAKDSVKNQQLIAFFDKALQIAQVMPGQIDLPVLYRTVAQRVFNLPLKDVFIEEKKAFTVDPEIENEALMSGKEVKVNDGDSARLHKESHAISLQIAIDEENQEAIASHLKHIKLHDVKEAADKIVMQQKAKLESVQLQLGEEGQQGERPQAGNPFQSQNPSGEGQILQGMRPVK